jgi:hypothetical protein
MTVEQQQAMLTITGAPPDTLQRENLFHRRKLR